MQQRTVGQYELGELVGAGTVGHAYRARHAETGQPAVIKLLQTHTATEPEIQRRFVREVAIAEKLNHPNIVRHYDCGLDGDQIFFAMELVDCGTLKEVLLGRGRLPWREAVECAIQICAALDYAHQQGIIHRDLKPANLFLSADGHVKVGDFGLARDLYNSRLTADGQTVGTCRYMPPEQITGEDELTGAVDLYALGCILYEMLVGRVPLDGSTIVEIFEAHLHDDPTPPAELVADCPADLSVLIVQLLAKDPQDRPAGAAVVRAALVDILHDRPMQLADRPADDSASELPPPADPAQPNLTMRLQSGHHHAAHAGPSKKGLLMALGLVAAIAVVAIVVSALR
jgi:eukaryotic-like serine/threonine-protein kinase